MNRPPLTKKYPRINQESPFTTSLVRRHSRRCPCGEPATRRVCIEYTYMRGDDEVEYRCEKHARVASFPIRNTKTGPNP